MTHIKDEATIKIHTAADGCVWYSEGVGPPQNSGQQADVFLRSAIVNSLSAQVRLLGIPSNADLIVEFFQRRQKRELANIQLAGPVVCGNQEDLKDPVYTLLRMRAIQASPSCGGWHAMTGIEFATYALLAQMQKNQFSYNMTSATYFRLNPLNKILNFIPHLNEASCANLLTTVIDPRWYVDTRMPDRSSKLELFLGLTPKVQRKVSDDATIITKRRDIRCATVLQCWKTRSRDTVDFDDPREFLWRVWLNSGAGNTGDLRASQTFVRFLRLNWLDLLDTRKGQKDGIFISQRFFKTKAEHSAFIAYLKKA